MIPDATIGVVATKGFIPGCIRLATRSHWNHVIIADGVGGCYEAQAGYGVRHLKDVPYAEVVWLTGIPITDAQRNQVHAYLFGECGQRYNYPAIAVFAIRTFCPWLPHKRLDSWADRRKNQICSELAVNAYRDAQFDLEPKQLAATVPPTELLDHELEKVGEA